MKSGRLYLVYPRVFAIHPRPYSPPQRRLAATYTGGPLSMISDQTAAVHLKLTEDHPPAIHLTVTGAKLQTGARPDHPPPRDRSARPLARRRHPLHLRRATIIDCAHAVGLEGTEQLIMAADSKRSLNRRRLEELVAEHRGRPGIAHVRALITDDPPKLRSENERRLFSICREFRVPVPADELPDPTSASRTFYADFCWPDLRLIVEADSWRWHGGRLAGERDRDRDQILSIAGWHVVHFTRDQIKLDRGRTGRRLVALTVSRPEA